MHGVLVTIEEYGVSGIIVFGAVLFVFIFLNIFKLRSQRDQVRNILDPKTTKTIINEKSGRVEKHEEDKKTEWGELQEFEKKFRRTCSWYEVEVQLVTLFPLLGILGTVAGLMLQVEAENVEGMMSSLGTAMETTLWGLIGAIALKFIMAIWPARYIFDVDALLDNYFQGFDRNIALNNVTKD